MALNIPMPESPGTSLLQGVDTGSSLMARIMQPIIERERMKQQQQQFVQDYALKKQAQDKANALLPYMIQQYQDTHRAAASQADINDLYRGIIQDALKNPGGGAPAAPVASPAAVGNPPAAPALPPQMGGGQVAPLQGGTPPQAGAAPQMGGAPNAPQGSPDMGTGQAPVAPPIAPTAPNQDMSGGEEHELRAGNPRLAKLDAVAGLVPQIPKPVTHISNGMIFTTYPSGRMTVQKMQGAQTPGQITVNAKEESKIRDQVTGLINSANLVQQGYELLDKNKDLTGPGNFISAIPIPFTGAKLNLSNNPELGKFKTVTGKLQAELGKYAASRGGIQAVRWAGSVKPDAANPEGYNYGMFDAVKENLQNDYNTLKQQYKAVTGRDLPVTLPEMKSTRGGAGEKSSKVTKWKMVGGQLVKE